METRQLGFWMCTALVIGNTIGMGIFMQPAALAPFGLNALTGWLAVIIGCACLALVFAALSRRLPQADGPFDYLRGTLGEPVAFAAIWAYWISAVVTLPTLAVSVVGYFLSAFPGSQVLPAPAMAVAFMWLFVGINLLGVRSGGRVQVITSLLKLVPLALVMVVGAAAILAEPAAYAANLPATPAVGLPASMAAASIALYAMLGFETATVAAGRARDPERTIPRATLIGTVIVAFVYVAAVAIGMLVVPQATLAASDAPFVTILDALVGPGYGRWLALFVVISGLGCLNGWTLVVAELGRTLAIKEFVPEAMGRLNRFGAPWVGLIIIGALGTFIGLMNYSESTVAGFTKLAVIVTAANLPLYACCAIATFLLWKRAPGLAPPALWFAAVGGLAFTAFAFFGVGLEPFVWAFVLSLAGLPIYFWMRRRHPDRAAFATPKM
ncbi:MAG TPA: amino acid permease [Steroidobacteraceae bacterium]|jgi:APA family basic amino acid/polyamine antiporter